MGVEQNFALHRSQGEVAVFNVFLNIQTRLLVVNIEKKDGEDFWFLDLGCGEGLNTQQLAMRLKTKSVVVGDLDLGCCQRAGNRVNKVEGRAVNLDMQRLPFSDATFDLVTLWESLEHAQDTNNVLREVSRVLKRGGCVALSTPNADCLNQRGKKILRRMGSLGERIAGEERPDHLSVLRWRELHDQLKQNSLEIIERIPAGLIPPIFWRVQDKLPGRFAGILAYIYAHSGRLAPNLASEYFLLCCKN